MIGQPEGMVAGRGCYNSTTTLGRGELQEGIAGAAPFEGSRALLVVEFAEYLSAGEFGQRNRFETGGDHHPICDAARGRADGRKSYRHARQANPQYPQVAKKETAPGNPGTASLPIAYTNPAFA